MPISVNSTSAFSCRSTNCSAACNFDLLFPNGWVTERLIVHAWKACVPKGTRGSNPRPSAPLAERAQEGDCITISHNNDADFNAVQRCVAKSSFRIAHSLPSVILKSVHGPVGAHERKSLLFLGAEGGSPLPHMPIAVQ